MGFVEIISFISAVIGLISGVVTILSIFWDIKDKKEITVNRFALIVFVICAGIFVVSFAISKNSSSVPTSASNNSVSKENSLISNINSGNTDSNSLTSEVNSTEPSSSNTTILPESDDLIDFTTGGNEKHIEPIMESLYFAESIPDLSYSIPIVNIVKYNGSTSVEEQIEEHQYVPQANGIHRLEFSNIPNGTDFRLRILNSGREQIMSGNDLDNGDGLTVSLTKNETYYILVEQYNNIGPYTLNIGQKRTL